MILWTPLAMEDIFAQQDTNQPPANNFVLEINGVNVQVSAVQPNMVQIERILSTDPRDFLQADLSPGRLVKLVPDT